MLQQVAKVLDTLTVFWHKWPVDDLALVIPLHPLSKLLAVQKPCSKLGGTTLNGREEGGQYYISQTCDQERLEARKVIFSWECFDSFATGCSFIWHCYWKFMLRITKRNFWGPNVLRFSGRECPIPSTLRSSFINLDKNTTLGTSLRKNACYAPKAS